MIFHTDQFSHYFGLEPYGFYKTYMQSYAVILFFVLSGFLITWSLVTEKETAGTINIRNFYVRRILRIWPLYYLVLITGLVLLATLPDFLGGFKRNLLVTGLAYGLFVPNIASYFKYAPDLINILWSVGAEEQFYAAWPWLIKNSKQLIEVMCWFLLAFLALKYILVYLDFPYQAARFMNYIPLDCMAIGGIAACLFNTQSKLLKIIYHPSVQVIAWSFFAVSLFDKPIHIPVIGLLNTDMHALVYAFIILNVSTNKKSLIKLENKILDFLGKISYGIYAFHFIVLFLLSLALRNMLPAMVFWQAHIVMFTAEIATTIFIAFFSWRYFESWFMKQKDKFAIMASTDKKNMQAPS